jgi:hypothetical protein
MGKDLKIKNGVFENLMASSSVEKMFKAHLPARISYPFALLMKSLQGKFETFMEEKRKILEKYCDRDDEGEPVKDKAGQYSFTNSETIKTFVGEFNELMDLETKINHERVRINISGLDSLELKLTPNDILSLEPLIEFVDDREPEETKVVPIGKKAKKSKGQKGQKGQKV